MPAMHKEGKMNPYWKGNALEYVGMFAEIASECAFPSPCTICYVFKESISTCDDSIDGL